MLSVPPAAPAAAWSTCTCCCLFHISITMLTSIALHAPTSCRGACRGSPHRASQFNVLAQLIVSQINPIAVLAAACTGLLCCHPQGRCRGKRVGVFGAFLLAIYNEGTEEYQTISKIGTGFSEEQLKDLADLLRPLTISDPRTYYRLVTVLPWVMTNLCCGLSCEMVTNL